MGKSKTRGKIVAVANQKGGVGKTTLTLHMAEYVARKHGRRVVVVDADPQGNASSWLLGHMPEESGLYNVLVARQEIGEQVVDVARVLQEEEDMEEVPWHIHLVPGNWETGEAMRFIAKGEWGDDYIAGKVRPLAEVFDLVLLDMPPSRLAGFRKLLLAADGVVIPTILERLSLEGVVFMRDVVVELRRKYGYAPRLMGIVPNMVRLTREHTAQLDELVEELEDVVWPPIPLSVRVAEASGYGYNLFDLAPRKKVTQKMAKTCERFWQATRLL